MPDIQSLAVLLLKPAHTHTRLSVKCTTRTHKLGHGECTVLTMTLLSPFGPILGLGPLGDRLYSLDIPYYSIAHLLSLTSQCLPQLQHLKIALLKNDNSASSNDIRLDPNTFKYSQLRTLVFTLPPADPLAVKFPYTEESPLDLSQFSALQHVLLRGPMVKHSQTVNGSHPFIVRPDVKVGWVRVSVLFFEL